jgi:uncharacterized alpha-E superfamily protein
MVARPLQKPLCANPTVSVIVAARNESGHIEELLARLPEMGGGTEIIFVEGNSTDDTFATIQRDQPYNFIRLGTYLERADNTARILSVKTRVEQAEGKDMVDDYYRLGAVLRSVSALEAYRDTYRDSIDADRVSELLIFNARVPRSLLFCLDETAYILDQLPQQTGREARKRCSHLLTHLRFGTLQEVYERGLETYLEAFVQENIHLAEAVQKDYLEMLA